MALALIKKYEIHQNWIICLYSYNIIPHSNGFYALICCSRSAKVLFAVYVTFFLTSFVRFICIYYVYVIYVYTYIIINVCEHKYNNRAFRLCVWVLLRLKTLVPDCKKKKTC